MTKSTLHTRREPAAAGLQAAAAERVVAGEAGPQEAAVCSCVFCCIERLPFGTTLARHATRIASRRLGKVYDTSTSAEIPNE